VFFFFNYYSILPQNQTGNTYFFRIVLAGITMKNNEVIRRATKADYDDIISIIPSGEYDTITATTAPVIVQSFNKIAKQNKNNNEI
jgi:hypothetical protein